MADQVGEKAQVRDRIAAAIRTSLSRNDVRHLKDYEAKWAANAVLDVLVLVRESQVRWVWPEIPAGWRYCDNQTFTNDGRMFRTATAAPKNENPYLHEHQHIEARRVEDERWVTPWAPAHSGSSDVRSGLTESNRTTGGSDG